MRMRRTLMLPNPRLTIHSHEETLPLPDPPLPSSDFDHLVDVLAVRSHRLPLPCACAEMYSGEVSHDGSRFAIWVEVDVLRRESVLGMYRCQSIPSRQLSYLSPPTPYTSVFLRKQPIRG